MTTTTLPKLTEKQERECLAKAKEAFKEGWAQPDFCWGTADKLIDPQNWHHVCLKTRDADLITESNAEAIQGMFDEACEAGEIEDDDYLPEVHNHWACGWLEVMCIRIYRLVPVTDEDRSWQKLPEDYLVRKDQYDCHSRVTHWIDATQPTTAFKLMFHINDRMDDYPLLDEEDYCQRENDATREYIRDNRPLSFEKNDGSIVDIELEDLPEDWDAEVFSWLFDNKQNEIENRDDRGGCPSTEAILEAMRALGYFDADSKDEPGDGP